jgi:hypothetical protein
MYLNVFRKNPGFSRKNPDFPGKLRKIIEHYTEKVSTLFLSLSISPKHKN